MCADHSVVGLDRRQFLKAGAALAGGLVLVVALPPGLNRGWAAGSSSFAPNAFIRIDRAGAATLMMPMVEMGQGVYTALSMLLAEELEVGLEQVRLEQAPPNDTLYANAILHIQTTGLSSSVRAFWTPLRQAGAVARSMLIAAAAERWAVDPGTCRARHGVVYDAAGTRHLPYGELVDAAASLPAPSPEGVALKQPKDFILIGRPARRLDSPEKLNGNAQFGIDATVPQMKFAAVALCPVFGGTVKSVNEAAAMAIAGVRQIVRLENAVAVVADHTWAAKKALNAAQIRWDEGANASLTSSDIFRQLEGESRHPGAVARHQGDPQGVLTGAARRFDVAYQLPFLAHAAMEPMNCTVHFGKSACEVWVGTQAPTLTQALVAELTGLPRSAITIHNHLVGGGFGRRLEVDGTLLAVKIAQHVDGPVKVIWSREEDIQHDMYRPAYYDRVSVGLDTSGKPVAWIHRVTGSSVVARYVPPLFKNGLDFDAVEAAAEPPYELPNIHVDYVRVEPPGIPTAFWRGVGPVKNVFIVESLMDDLAAAVGQDPVAYRKSLLSHNPRALAVLNLATEKAGWGKPLPPRHGRGVSLQSAFGSYMSQVAEVEVAQDGTVRVHRLVCAVDCGIVVNPDTIAAQVEGGSLFGLTALLYGAITLKGGRVEQSNFHDYRPIRMNEAPLVETHIVRNTEAPGGFGEAPCACVAPAVTNGIFAATGKRIRTLPIDPRLLKA